MNHKKAALKDYFDEKQQKFYLDFAKDYLRYLGNDKPTITQLEDFQWLLCQMQLPHFISIDSRLSYKESIRLYLSALGCTNKEISLLFYWPKR